MRWVTNVGHVPDTLWEQCFPPPLEGRWWYAALERSKLEDQFEFRYGIIGRGGRMIGIVPAFLMNVPIDLVAPRPIAVALRSVGRLFPRLRYQRTLFIGSPCSDEGTVGLINGETLGDLVPTIADAVKGLARSLGAPMHVWKDFLESDALQIVKKLASDKWFTIASFPGTRLQLPDGANAGFNAYLKTLSGSHRHNLKKKLRKAENALPTSATTIQNLKPAEVDEVLGLFMQTYDKGETKFERLGRSFFDAIAESPASTFILLRDANGALVAFMLAFAQGKRAINKFIGIDYARADGDAFLYFQLWKAFIAWSTNGGATELQSGQTGYRAKLDVGHSLVPLFNVCRHRNALLNRIFTFATKDVSWSSLDHDLANYLTAHPDEDRCRLN